MLKQEDINWSEYQSKHWDYAPATLEELVQKDFMCFVNWDNGGPKIYVIKAIELIKDRETGKNFERVTFDEFNVEEDGFYYKSSGYGDASLFSDDTHVRIDPASYLAICWKKAWDAAKEFEHNLLGFKNKVTNENVPDCVSLIADDSHYSKGSIRYLRDKLNSIKSSLRDIEEVLLRFKD